MKASKESFRKGNIIIIYYDTMNIYTLYIPCKPIDHGSVLYDHSVQPATPPRPARCHTILVTKVTHLVTELLYEGIR